MTLSSFTAKPQDCMARQPCSVVLKVSLVRARAGLARLGLPRIAFSFDARSDILREASGERGFQDGGLESGLGGAVHKTSGGIVAPGDYAGRLQCHELNEPRPEVSNLLFLRFVTAGVGDMAVHTLKWHSYGVQQ